MLYTTGTAPDHHICTANGHKKPFFSKDACAMADHLVEAATLGYLSDPSDIALYFRIGKDKDGLHIYHTIRGTNSVEGEVHMTVCHVFGSLQASPKLAECLLLNWILHHNCTVFFFISRWGIY